MDPFIATACFTIGFLAGWYLQKWTSKEEKAPGDQGAERTKQKGDDRA